MNTQTNVSAVPAVRANAFNMADKVTANDRLNNTINECIAAKEIVVVGALNVMLSLVAAVGIKGMADFPILGSEQDKSNNPENYSIPAKNDKGETISRPGNFYSDYVERFDVVKACRTRQEAIKEERKAEQGDDIALGREYDRLTSRITTARSLVRSGVGIYQQKVAIEALGLRVGLATVKNEEGEEVADGSNKPCTVMDMDKGTFKNLSVSSFLALDPEAASAAIAKGKDKYDAILATGSKRKPKTGDDEADDEAGQVSDMNSFMSAFFGAASWFGEHETAITARLHRDMKGKDKDYELLAACFAMHEMLTPIVQSASFKSAFEHYVLNVTNKQAA